MPCDIYVTWVLRVLTNLFFSSSSFQNGDMQYQADCHFIDKLLEETSTDKLFRPPKLFPPDIDKVIQARLCDRGDSKQPKQ